MAFYDNFSKKNNNSANRDFESIHNINSKDKTADQVKQQQINADPLDFNEKSYTSPTYPMNEQAKDKLSAAATRKAAFAKAGMFDTKIGNLDMDTLKYVIKDTDKDRIYNLLNSNEIDKNNKLGLNLPDFIYGGGENDLMPIDGIDFTKHYLT